MAHKVSVASRRHLASFTDGHHLVATLSVELMCELRRRSRGGSRFAGLRWRCNLRPGGCALSALKLALGDIRSELSSSDLALRATTPADLSDGSCRTDFSDYPRHTPSHTVRREARGHISVVVFASFRHQDDVFIQFCDLCTPRESYDPNYPFRCECSLAGQRVAQGGKFARTL
jgi:hypothetical protein